MINPKYINDYKIDKVYDENVQEDIDQGMGHKEAKEKAGDNRVKAHKSVNRLLAQHGLIE